MKKMVLLALGLLSVSTVYAECHTQKTIPLSTWYKSSGGMFNVWVSNRASHDVSILIKLHRTNGTLYTEATEPGSNISVFGQFTSSPVEGETVLSAGYSEWLYLPNGGNEEFGYAELSWSGESTHSPWFSPDLAQQIMRYKHKRKSVKADDTLNTTSRL